MRLEFQQYSLFSQTFALVCITLLVLKHFCILAMPFVIIIIVTLEQHFFFQGSGGSGGGGMGGG